MSAHPIGQDPGGSVRKKLQFEGRDFLWAEPHRIAAPRAGMVLCTLDI